MDNKEAIDQTLRYAIDKNGTLDLERVSLDLLYAFVAYNRMKHNTSLEYVFQELKDYAYDLYEEGR